METGPVTQRRSERSCAPLTDTDFACLSDLASEDHLYFTRPRCRPEYRDRRVAVVLAQGAAMHYLDGTTGVADLDVWTFYSTIPGVAFRFGQRKRRLDFGPSEHGRNLYPADFRHPELPRWLRFEGRRIDLMIRNLPVAPAARPATVIDALRDWLTEGAATPLLPDPDDMPSNWWLSHKAARDDRPAPQTQRRGVAAPRTTRARSL